MVDSLDEAVRCAEDALRDLDGTRFERVANLMRFLDVGAESCLAEERWRPDTGAAGVRLGRLLLELGLRQEAERMFRLLFERLVVRGVPEPDWGEQGEPFHRSGWIVRGNVIRADQSGLFVRVAFGVVGLVRIEELTDDRLLVGVPTATPEEEIFVKIIDIDADRRRVELSARQADEALGADPADAVFDPELYGGTTDFPSVSMDGTARSLFEQHRRSVIQRQRRAPG